MDILDVFTLVYYFPNLLTYNLYRTVYSQRAGEVQYLLQILFHIFLFGNNIHPY